MKITLPHRWIYFAISLIILAIPSACVEQVNIDISDEQSSLVVHAILTDEYKKQEIVLTRTYAFNLREAPVEAGATVEVITDSGTTYAFEELELGTYTSIDAFKAVTDTSYVLHITTRDGHTYRSEAKQLVGSVSIDSFKANLITNEAQEEGLSFELSSSTPNSNGTYYRIDFEETYKIIAPYWSAYDAVIFAEGFFTVDVRAILRETEERVCYGAYKSTQINLIDTHNYQEDKLVNLPIQFLKKLDPKGMYRYSIEVKQYALDDQTYAYYQALKEVSDASTTVFTQSQPGLINSNIYAESNSEEIVLGYFEVSGVASKRIFVDYRDFYPEGNRPAYFYACQTEIPAISGRMGERPLLEAIKSDALIYFSSTLPGEVGPFIMVLPYCGDCTRIGSNQKPEFWIDED